MRLGGWTRLWMLVSVIWGLVVGLFAGIGLRELSKRPESNRQAKIREVVGSASNTITLPAPPRFRDFNPSVGHGIDNDSASIRPERSNDSRYLQHLKDYQNVSSSRLTSILTTELKHDPRMTRIQEFLHEQREIRSIQGQLLLLA